MVVVAVVRRVDRQASCCCQDGEAMSVHECADHRCGMFRQVVVPIAHPDGGPVIRCPVCLSTTLVRLEADIAAAAKTVSDGGV
jgi:hypothetical protein